MDKADFDGDVYARETEAMDEAMLKGISNTLKVFYPHGDLIFFLS